MKVGRTTLLILLVGLFAAGTLYIYSAGNRETAKQDEIMSNVSATQAQLPPLISQKAGLEAQLVTQQELIKDQQAALAKAQSALILAEASFPQDVQSVDYSDTLTTLAQQNNLEVSSIQATEPAPDKVETITFDVTELEIEVRPADPMPTDVEEFRAYIDEAVYNFLKYVDGIVRTAHFKTATMPTVDMKNLLPPTEENIKSAEKPAAVVKLQIFAYKGG